MIKVADFHMDHLADFETEEVNVKETMEYTLSVPNRRSFSLYRGNDLICIAGMNILRPGVGELWLLRSVHIDKCKFEFFKTIHVLVNRYLPTQGFHRLEMAVDAEKPELCKWATKLGFSLMGVARKYDLEGRDHYVFDKVGF
jgi:hypothetical protein